MSTDSSSTARRGTPDPRLPVRAGRLLRVPAIWVAPLVVGSLVIAIMTVLYIGSVVNPQAHLRGLPVAIVNQDQGATVGSQHVDFGQQVQAGLLSSPKVSGPLRLEPLTLPQAEGAMGRDGLYATVVIPPGFTASLLNVAGLSTANSAASTAPETEILTNQRAGTEGVGLATGILQPALASASRQIGQHLAAMVPASSLTGATKVLLANPVTVTTTQYQPLPANTALGLTAFYVSLLVLMCGFLGASIANSVVDSALGYSTNDIGPRWRQRQPVPINRWQTLLIKWTLVAPLTAVLPAVMLVIAAAGLGMDTPHPVLLWLFAWLCAASVGAGTIALFAVAGTYGQLIGVLLFVYAGLASAGGTVPLEALPTVLRLLSYVEPLRQVLAGTRSILYFGAQGTAGLTRGMVAAAAGLVFWLVIGTIIVRWYDRRRFYRIDPDIIAHVSDSVQEYKARHATAPAPVPAPSADGHPPAGEAPSSASQPAATDETGSAEAPSKRPLSP
jgi:YhgE/Pip-like protein